MKPEFSMVFPVRNDGFPLVFPYGIVHTTHTFVDLTAVAEDNSEDGVLTERRLTEILANPTLA